MKTGILLLNFGGPWTMTDVKPFLYRLFANPRVLVGVPTPFRQMLAFAIAQLKGPSSIKSYRMIGGGSPQLKWTVIQAEGLRELLESDSIRVEIGMRSAEPSIKSALEQLKFWGAERLLLLPLFPQYSTTTTGTCFDEVERAMTKLNWAPAIQQVTSWSDRADYTGLVSRLLSRTVAKAEAERGTATDPIHILFSAHSLPMKIVERGDPYPQDVDNTVAAVAQNLEHPWSLAFQSRNGKMPWLKPYLEDELKRLAKAGVRRVVVVPISFVSDHIETLFELDLLYAGTAKKHGITHYYRADCFNGHPDFPRVLHSIVTEVWA
jgi:ferrochelatase